MSSVSPSADQQFLDDLEKKLWNAADRLRSNLDAVVYKHTVLGLIHGIDFTFGKKTDATFLADQQADLRADYVMANPPFNDSDWFHKDDDMRWYKGETDSNSKRSWR